MLGVGDCNGVHRRLEDKYDLADDPGYGGGKKEKKKK